MKRILLVCLLGMGLLWPSTTITAGNPVYKRIIDVLIEGDWLRASSDELSGIITTIDIYDSENQKVYGEYCGSYECLVDVSGLPADNYLAKVVTASGTSYLNFAIN